MRKMGRDGVGERGVEGGREKERGREWMWGIELHERVGRVRDRGKERERYGVGEGRRRGK
jgi:hypothetical protein